MVESHVAFRIRKLKCDEERPACRRCVSTGRVCDGYGVWGGGGNFYGHRQRSAVPKNDTADLWRPACLSILADCSEGKRYFEWFMCRTVKKIPGLFVSTFWESLIFQASLSEPAVLHAVLTLSSVHKREIFDGHDQTRTQHIPRKQEQFMLQHYINAIRHLQPHFSTRSKKSARVALITCVVFVCLEYLLGRFKTAEAHLQSGLKVLRELQTPLDTDETGAFPLEASLDSVDDWIIHAFSRLYVQVELFKQSYQHPYLVLQVPESQSPIFHSINEAWQRMERLLNKIFHLTEKARQQNSSRHASIEHNTVLIGDQQKIQAELARWLNTYEASRQHLQAEALEEFAYQFLCGYYTMAHIMVEMCLHHNDESRYDSHTEQFVALINRKARLWHIRSSYPEIEVLPGHCVNMAKSVVDIGWIPPLYYIALKCRIHRIRVHAVRLLETSSHREGMWDSNITACIARKVMEIEERDFYKNSTLDDFSLSRLLDSEDLSQSAIPESYRICDVKAVLSDGPEDSVFLYYKQKQKDESKGWKTCVKEYHLPTQCWFDR